LTNFTRINDNGCMSASDPTVAELLTAVNAAIYALVIGKAKIITIGGRTYHYNNLDELRAMRTELKKEARIISGSIRLADISGT